MLLVKVFCSEQIMTLYIVYKSEGGQMISAINSQVIAKLHRGSERAKIREVLNKEKIREVLNKEKIREVLNKEKIREVLNKEKIREVLNKEKIREVINKEKQSFQFWKAHHSNFPSLSIPVSPSPP